MARPSRNEAAERDRIGVGQLLDDQAQAARCGEELWHNGEAYHKKASDDELDLAFRRLGTPEFNELVSATGGTNWRTLNQQAARAVDEVLAHEQALTPEAAGR